VTITDTRPADSPEDVILPEPPESPPVLRQQAKIRSRQLSELTKEADKAEHHQHQDAILAAAVATIDGLNQELVRARAAEAEKLAIARKTEDRAKASADLVKRREDDKRKADASEATPEVIADCVKNIGSAQTVLSEAITAAEIAYREHQLAAAHTASFQDQLATAEDTNIKLHQVITDDEDLIPRSHYSFIIAAGPLLALMLERPLTIDETAFARLTIGPLAERSGLADALRQEGRDDAEKEFGAQPVLVRNGSKQMVAPPGSAIPRHIPMT
jgi:hypothetical protein